MQIPVQVTFRGLPVSDTLEAAVRNHAARLERYYDRITRCDVTIAEHHRHRTSGRLYSISIDMTVPGEEIVINREHDLDVSREDVHVAIRDAFDAARRRLEDYIRRRREQGMLR